jgi:hypothetical protein
MYNVTVDNAGSVYEGKMDYVYIYNAGSNYLAFDVLIPAPEDSADGAALTALLAAAAAGTASVIRPGASVTFSRRGQTGKIAVCAPAGDTQADINFVNNVGL